MLVTQAINSVETKRGASVKTSPMRASAARPYLSCGQESESIGTVESDDLAHDLLIFPDNVRVHGVKPANSTKPLRWIKIYDNDSHRVLLS